jgi:RNA polymerase sigma factor (sigma-70 family)
MGDSAPTCWTVIEGAAAGVEADRDAFARRYMPIARAYLAARWGATPLAGEVDDAAQEVFVACFQDGGALGRADRTREGGFRAYFCGVIRNVALRAERARAQRRDQPVDSSFDPDAIAADEPSLSSVFERAWASSLLKQAGVLQTERAAQSGGAAERRVELLRLRFESGLPIRDIAAKWGADPRRLHHEYATARDEFREALREIVAFHLPGTRAEVDAECSRLLHAIR